MEAEYFVVFKQNAISVTYEIIYMKLILESSTPSVKHVLGAKTMFLD